MTNSDSPNISSELAKDTSFGIDDVNTLASKVRTYVIEDLIRGRWAPGEKIFEARVARELGVSHVPVREAMEQLRQDGWVTRVPNRGVVVRQMSNDNIMHLFQMREVLECSAARIVAKTITKQQIDTLWEIIEKRKKAWQIMDKQLLRDADICFHRSLIQFVGNPRMEEVFESILLQSSGLFFGITSELPFFKNESWKKKSSGHTKIVQILETKSPAKSERIIRAHIQSAYKTTKKLLEFISQVEQEHILDK